MGRRKVFMLVLSVCVVLGGGCRGNDEVMGADEGWGSGPGPPAWVCGGSEDIAGEILSWVLVTRIDGELTRWSIDGFDRDSTVRLQQDSGPDHFGPCAVAQGDLIGFALPMGPLYGGESETFLLVTMREGAGAYELPTELSDSAPPIVVTCGLHQTSVSSTRPSSGTVEVASLPTSPTAALRVIGHAEGDCAFDFDISMLLHPDYFLEN